MNWWSTFVTDAPKSSTKAENEIEVETVKDFNASKLIDTKTIAVGCWNPLTGLVEVTKMRGNFWKICGFSIQQKNYLYPEEALYLAEKCGIR